MRHISLQIDPFDVGHEHSRLTAIEHSGAISAFTGTVRGEHDIAALSIEHHPVMTIAQLERLGDISMKRYRLNGVIIIHRYGVLRLGEPIVFVAASCAHRKEAIEAVSFIMDRLKTDIPLWKKEIFSDGSSRWIEQKQSDVVRSSDYD